MTAFLAPRGIGINNPSHRRLSEILAELTTLDTPRISISDMVEILGERSFAAFMILLAIPNMFFFVPGASVITGLPLIFISAQLLMGRSALWLPRALAARSIERVAFARIMTAAIPYVQRIERLARPRLWLASKLVAERLIGTASMILAIFMFLPIPFANSVPAIALIMLALALSEKDGIWLIIGVLGTVVSTVLVTAILTVGLAAIIALIG